MSKPTPNVERYAQILALIQAAPEPMQRRDIAAQMGIVSDYISTLLCRMKRQGLVESMHLVGHLIGWTTPDRIDGFRALSAEAAESADGWALAAAARRTQRRRQIKEEGAEESAERAAHCWADTAPHQQTIAQGQWRAAPVRSAVSVFDVGASELSYAVTEMRERPGDGGDA
jgi:hypothetical protein